MQVVLTLEESGSNLACLRFHESLNDGGLGVEEGRLPVVFLV
jgi:hypothetical protein